MPTYRKDLHLGHEVTLVETDDLMDGAITERKMADGAITERKMADASISHRTIQPDAVDGSNIKPESIGNGHLSPDAVHTRNIKDKAVTPEKVSDDFFAPLRAKDADLQNQIDSLEIAGVAVSNEFGDDSHISVSQKTLTAAFSRVWAKFEDMTGEVLQGISMVVSPEYYIGEDGADVHIQANTVEANGIFEYIAFYINGTLLIEADNVDYFEYDTHITETSVVKCEAKIMGITYTREKNITHYNSFWLGAGSSYQDIMNVQHVIPITNGMRGAYNVDVAQGDHIIVVVGESLAGGFLRADLNSVEINFTESTVTVDGKNYKVFTSEESYSAGTYNIDING